MRQVPMGASGKQEAAIVQGCMRIDSMSVAQVEALVQRDLELGINFFDHADCYGDGVCEELFGKVLAQNPGLRDKMTIQSKCGIHKQPLYYFDFSKEHIVSAVEASLKRLQTDHLDYLLLHRPDALVEPEEVAAAFDALESAGKVLHFGVSNQHPRQMELLKKHVRQPLEINQLQFSIAHTGMIDFGLSVNTRFEGSLDHDGGVLDYCRLNDCTIQAWSPFQYGFFDGVFVGNGEKYPELNKVLDALAAKYGVTSTAIAVAWILRHPAKMQVVFGSVNIDRVGDIAAASDVVLSKVEWYQVYCAAGNFIP